MDRDWTLDGRVKRKQESDVTTCSACFKTFPKGSARGITVGCSGVGDTPCPFQDERESAKELPAEVEGS